VHGCLLLGPRYIASARTAQKTPLPAVTLLLRACLLRQLPSNGRYLQSRFLPTAISVGFTILAFSRHATIILCLNGIQYGSEGFSTIPAVEAPTQQQLLSAHNTWSVSMVCLTNVTNKTAYWKTSELEFKHASSLENAKCLDYTHYTWVTAPASSNSQMPGLCTQSSGEPHAYMLQLFETVFTDHSTAVAAKHLRATAPLAPQTHPQCPLAYPIKTFFRTAICTRYEGESVNRSEMEVKQLQLM
jgi:hypothetical protein